MPSVAFPRESRLSASLILTGALLSLLLFSSPAFSVPVDPVEATAEYRAWVDRHERHFAAHPELYERKGAGWKPFHRQKWFTESRMVDGLLPDADARAAAWRERLQLTSRRVNSQERPWFSLGPENLAGRMLSIAFDPVHVGVLYAGAAGGGLWKSTDNGSSWKPLTDDLPSLAVGGVCVSPADPDVVVIATGEGTFNIDRIGGVGILRSTDAGRNWSATNVTASVSSGHGFHFVRANAVTGTMLAGATDGLYRSTDDGVTWTTIKTGGHYFDAVWRPGSATTVFTVRGDCGCAGANVKVSTDDGLTWATAGTGGATGTTVGKSKLAVTAANPDYVYAIHVNASTSGMLGLYRTTDGGATWSLRASSPNIPGGQGWYNLSLAADPGDPEKIIAGGVSLYRSVNGGASFSVVGGNVHVDHHLAEYDAWDSNTLWVGSDGGLWRSTDDGASWSDRNDGLVTYQFYDVCVNRNAGTPYYVLGGTQDNGTDRYSGTTTWSEGLGGDGMVCNINEVNGTSVFGETQFGGHYRNTSSGTGAWSPIQVGITGTGQWVAPVAQDPARGGSLYTETDDGIFRTTTGGTSGWSPVATHRAVWIDFSRIDGNVAWTTHGTGTWITTDDGSSWTKAAAFGFSTGTPTKVHAHPADVDGAFVTFSGYSSSIAHVALTTDRGATWANVSGDLPGHPVNAIAIDPDYPIDWYVGTDVGVYKSDTGGVNWIPLGEGSLPNTVVSDLEISGPARKLVAGTHGRGAWELDIPLPAAAPRSDVTAAVASPENRSLLLDAPWPNPATDRVTLRFASRSEGAAELAVYDVGGRLVTRLGAVPHDGIIRTATWLPDDHPAGAYFAVLRAGTEQVSRKIIVAR